MRYRLEKRHTETNSEIQIGKETLRDKQWDTDWKRDTQRQTVGYRLKKRHTVRYRLEKRHTETNSEIQIGKETHRDKQ